MSNVIRFEINSKIFYKDLEYVVKGYPSFDEVLIKRDVTPFYEKIVKVKDLITEPKNIKEDIKTLVDLEQKDFDKATERYEIIKTLLDKKDKTAKDVLKDAKKHKKGIATIYRWLNTYEQYGNISSLSSKREFCGAKGKSRLDKSVDTVINRVIDEYYLNKQKYPLQMIYEEIVYKCKNMELKAPTKNTVRSRINNLHPKIIAKNRKGLKVDETRGMPSHFPEVKMPLDIIQIDHTKVDVILVDEETRQPIGRPFITVAIDVFSRMIFGFYISLEAPSYFSVGQCLLNAILPKDDFMKKNGIEGEWVVYGLPKKVHMDNGKDFRSASLQNFCKEYRIEDIYRPVARPAFGGAIERLIGTCMKKVHLLPGTTFSNIQQKGEINPDKNASMTFSEFERFLVTFITKIYHKRLHEGIKMSPEQLWDIGIFGDEAPIGLPPKPSDPQSVLIDFLPYFKRTIQKNGINIEGLNYYDYVLRSKIHEIDEETGRKKQFICKRDPRNIKFIWFYDDNVQQYYKISVADQSLPNMTLWEYDLIKRNLYDKGIQNINHAQIIEAHEELYQQIESSVKKSKKARREQQRIVNKDKEIKTFNESEAQLDKKIKIVDINNDTEDDNIPDFG